MVFLPVSGSLRMVLRTSWDKFVGGIPGEDSAPPGLPLYTPLTATASGVRSALLNGLSNRKSPSCVSGKPTERLDPKLV